MDSREFFRTVAQRAALSREEAADLTRATLETLAHRLSPGEARDLAVHVPEPLDESLRVRTKSAEKFGLDEFVRRVSERTGLNVAETTEGARAVLTTLREALPEEEFDRAMSQIPQEFRAMLQPAESE